jgi:quercetin dioxygenase-like cupin family protein
MKLEDIPFSVTDWDAIQATEHSGGSGKALWKTLQIGNVRIRMVEYTPRYVADHWCNRGHILLVLEGELVTELDDGRIFTLTPGMTYQVATDAAPHRSSTRTGAKLFIVD